MSKNIFLMEFDELKKEYLSRVKRMKYHANTSNTRIKGLPK